MGAGLSAVPAFISDSCIVMQPDITYAARRYKMLTKNGVIVQHADGTLQAVSPKIANKHLSEMPEEQRAMYEAV